ncbi:chemotaxis-specific protein-glutamate methyltransferase CheB [Sphingomonas solaris]|uniref:protein-glutamate methylesterase n=2 Tax=Alterirhizorhabdus solaris TaxID=2529389 RepID=A0A558QWU1_9SPHN|nr:chemotaxis-specific protein-glutamate methyltransferase CheB [Sphingomonas solaris]
MIVDDSLVARTVMARILTGHADFEVTAQAATVAQALDLLGGCRVDIILLDVQMPGQDGLSALPALLARAGGARVLMVSGATADGAEATVRALTQGAADTLLKPAAIDFAGSFAATLVERVRRIGRAPAVTGPVSRRRPGSAGRGAGADGVVECIAIGASTGGPHALSALLAALPESLEAPVLVTQHLPAAFMPFFARQLEDIARREVSVARDGALLVPGRILIAPGDSHLRVARSPEGVRVALDSTPAASGHLPSVDPMLVSVADVFGPAAIGVVLSGMGRDGLIGAGLLAARGGEIIVQDQASSVVWGMPGVIARAGLAAAMLPPDGIARHIGARCRQYGYARWM